MTPTQEHLFAIVCEERDLIRRVVLRSGVDFADVDDACQAALLQAWKLISNDRLIITGERDLRDAIRRWLFVVTRKTSGRWLRGERSDDSIDEDALGGPSPTRCLEAREQLRILGYRLNREERALMLALARGDTTAEIADDLRLPAGTVSTRVRKLRSNLRRRVPR